jgi:hypothetical protein
MLLSVLLKLLTSCMITLKEGAVMRTEFLAVQADDQSELDCRIVVHSLLHCPTFPKGTRYCLASRDSFGQRTVLGYGMALNTHPPLNLAIVRQRGAKLGANEVLVIEPLEPPGKP